jgi:hypothetical protein
MISVSDYIHEDRVFQRWMMQKSDWIRSLFMIVIAQPFTIVISYSYLQFELQSIMFGHNWFHWSQREFRLAQSSINYCTISIPRAEGNCQPPRWIIKGRNDFLIHGKRQIPYLTSCSPGLYLSSGRDTLKTWQLMIYTTAHKYTSPRNVLNC